jgi:hypothetical protein
MGEVMSFMCRGILLVGLMSLSMSRSIAQTTISFQNGVNSYVGAQDCDIRQNNPTFNSQNWQFNDVAFSDASDSGQTNAIQILLRFNNILGPNAVPIGATIVSATLQLTTAPFSRTGEGHGGTFHRMLRDWDANTVTWSSLTNGVSADNIEARTAVSFQAGQVPDILQPGPISFDVTADVRAWANRQPNFGWATLPLVGGTNGWGIQTSDQGILADRPKLTVTYIVPAPGALLLVLTGAVPGTNLMLRRRRGRQSGHPWPSHRCPTN